MKGSMSFWLVVLSACCLPGPSWGQDATDAALTRDTIVQVSTIDALLLGVYDGAYSCGWLRHSGDLGIGTFDALDGEMTLIDGRIYRIRSDGKVEEVADEVKTPFASVTVFDRDKEFAIEAIASFDALKARLDAERGGKNLMYAVRIDGRFAYVKTRSVPRQAPPYPPLAEVTRHQPEFEIEHVRGTLAGFWLPEYLSGVNVPGYHLHFLTDGRDRGGHVLECRIESGTVWLDESISLRVVLPPGGAFQQADLEQDRTKELEAVEK